MQVNGLVTERHRKHREERVKKNRDGLQHVGGEFDKDVRRALDCD